MKMAEAISDILFFSQGREDVIEGGIRLFDVFYEVVHDLGIAGHVSGEIGDGDFVAPEFVRSRGVHADLRKFLHLS